MNLLHLPWVELAIVVPICSAIWVATARDPDVARRRSLIACGIALACVLVGWFDYAALDGQNSEHRLSLFAPLSGQSPFALDRMSAPLLPLAALLYFLTVLATPRTKFRLVSFAWLLAGESILLATLGSQQPWTLIALLAAGTVPVWIELRARRHSTRLYVLHMGLFVGLLIVGESLIGSAPPGSQRFAVGIAMLIAAVLIRSGVAPLHCWMIDLFENAAFGTALLFVTPMVGAYAATRLVIPIAPDWGLKAIAGVSLLTAVYAAGMALVQHEARRFFCYLFLSNSSLVLVGLAIPTPIGATGALYVWLSVGLSLAGFGLSLRSVEARTGRLSLDEFHGLYDHLPRLASLFLITGLASIGFPGTVGFVGAELLVEGAVQLSPIAGAIVVVVAALNGLAVLHAFFRVFTGTRHMSSIELHTRASERAAVLILITLILGGGLYPQPGVESRYDAAAELLARRRQNFPAEVAKAHSAPAEHAESTDQRRLTKRTGDAAAQHDR